MEIKNQEIRGRLQIKTPRGFEPFEGVKRYWHEESLDIIFSDGSRVASALDHRFVEKEQIIYAKGLKKGDKLSGIEISEIRSNKEGGWFYDPVNVGQDSVYLHDDGFVSHNTFHGSGETLISGDKLLRLESANPVYEQDSVKVYERPNPDSHYMMFVDVAKGRGQDYSTFNVIDISARPFRQVAVYRNNMISPLLYPDVIYKYARTYNDAFVLIESNDAGQVVCNGLYYDLEYENVYVESTVKANAIGVNMTRKVKRIGTSTLKDLIEEDKLEVQDPQTIIELSTYIAKGQSFEASNGNHDDLVMNLVLFAWFTTLPIFMEYTDIDVKHMLYEEQIKMIEDDMVPFGEINNGLDPNTEVVDGDVWVQGGDDFGIF